MIVYAFKRVVRSWKLFIALLLGVVLASSFFAGINISIDSIGTESLKQQLEQVYGDVLISSPGIPTLSTQNVTALENLILSNVEGADDVDVVSKTGADLRSVSLGRLTPGQYQTLLQLSAKVWFPDGSNYTFIPILDNIIGVHDTSYISTDIALHNEQKTLEENETFIEADSGMASMVNIGDKINVTIPVIVGSGNTAQTHYVNRTLSVAAFVNIDDRSYSMSLGLYTVPQFSFLSASTVRRVYHNFLIVDWDKTFASILDEVHSFSPTSSSVNTALVVSIDRNLINPWDVEGSRINVDKVVSILTNTIQVSFSAQELSITDNLLNVLRSYETFSTLMILQGIILSLPVFFVAWYVGLTVSDVSFHLRRREIGLLLAKGFTNSQLFRLFLTEAIIIGIVGAVAGVALGMLFTPLFTSGQFYELVVPQLDVIIAVTIFSVAIALVAVYQPARRAANFKVLDTLREYFIGEEAKAHRKIWIWIALVLGTYKISMLILGLNLSDVLPSAAGIAGGRGGFISSMLIRIVTFIDSILLYLGPILFFWSFTKIFVAGSVKFQNAIAKITAPIIKDLSRLAERNVQRNIARIASTTFLLAIIVGYTVSATGQIATQEDFVTRLIYENVGADINASPESVDNVAYIRDYLLSNVSGIASIAVEYRGFSGQTLLGTDFGSTQLVAINPDEWLSTAYYEPEWYTGNMPSDQMIRALSNETIILEGRFSEYLSAGSSISLTAGGKTFNLKVLGFFGPSSTEELNLAQQGRARLILRSYISESLYSEISKSVSATTRILVKLEPNVYGKEIAEVVRNVTGVEYADSAAEQIETREENMLLSGSLNISRLGVVFAALAASVGTALVTVATLLERRKEITLLMVKGFSIRQVILTLLTENLGTLLIAGLMGGFVGYLIDRGNVASSRAVSLLVTPRVIFPVDAVINVFMIFSLVVASAVLPVVIMVILKSSKLVWRT
jgi:putative ABC transport system permease protein